MGCSCCTSSIADGAITQTEHDAKVFNLQCRFKDLVAKITDKWRYGIFCPEDSDTIIEIRGLLRLLICYGKETEEVLPDDAQVPECYNDYILFNGTDLNTVPTLAAANIGPFGGEYFLITSPYTGTYYILKSVRLNPSFFPNSTFPISSTLSELIYSLDQGETPYIGEPIITNGSIFRMDILCSGIQVDLLSALTASQGVTVTSSGLSDANLLLITEKIEKLLAC
tara:strand:- start:237 stop:911 length:675 start_codon:yes stop_codon:yes gene_type:complete